MSAHTPGPWAAADLIENDGCVRVTWTDETGFEWQVAYARPCPGPNLETPEDNARLIAASFDLLEAAKKALAAFAHGDINDEQTYALRDLFNAIGKATLP